MAVIDNADALKVHVWDAVHRIPAIDMHTHLYDARFGSLLLRGVDELLTYHYLVAELFRTRPAVRRGAVETALTTEAFFALPKPRQAEWVWRKVFLEQSPVGEAARGVLTSLGMQGIDPASRDLDGYRRFFAEQGVSTHIDRVFRAANLESAVMTNDPFDDRERAVWEKGGHGDKRFLTSRRIDPLLVDWKNTAKRLKNGLLTGQC